MKIDQIKNHMLCESLNALLAPPAPALPASFKRVVLMIGTRRKKKEAYAFASRARPHHGRFLFDPAADIPFFRTGTSGVFYCFCFRGPLFGNGSITSEDARDEHPLLVFAILAFRDVQVVGADHCAEQGH